jgi:hypothetical protein
MSDHPEMVVVGEAVLGSCDISTYDSVYFYINGRYYEIPPSAFIIEVSGGRCALAFVRNTYNLFIMGTSMLFNYYSVWDEDNSQMALVPHLESQATVTTATAPTDIYDLTTRNAYPFSYDKYFLYVWSSYAAYSSFGVLSYYLYLR